MSPDVGLKAQHIRKVGPWSLQAVLQETTSKRHIKNKFDAKFVIG
jgi:hypothetical protein